MMRRSRLGTVLRLAHIDELNALREFATASHQAEQARAALHLAERARQDAARDSLPPVHGTVTALSLQCALERARSHTLRAETLRPGLEAAEANLSERRAGLARERLRTRGLRNAVARRDAARGLVRRRREALAIDDLSRAARQTEEIDGD